MPKTEQSTNCCFSTWWKWTIPLRPIHKLLGTVWFPEKKSTTDKEGKYLTSKNERRTHLKIVFYKQAALPSVCNLCLNKVAVYHSRAADFTKFSIKVFLMLRVRSSTKAAVSLLLLFLNAASAHTAPALSESCNWPVCSGLYTKWQKLHTLTPQTKLLT